MLWACIALPQLALDTVLRQHEDPSQPVVLLGGPLQRRLLVAANAAAQALGLRVGQRLVEAQAISDVFTALPHDPADDLRQQRWLAAWAYRYTHRVSLDWPDALLLEVGASLQLMGGWQALEARLHVDLQQLGFVHRIAVAPSARAAHLLAWLRDGLCFFEPDTLLHALERVPVRRALLPGETGEALHRMGIRRLGALFDTPRDGLQRRFGDELLVHIDQLRGLQSEVLHFYTPPDHFVLRRELPWRVENHRSLMFPLRRMIDDLVVFLSDHDRGVQHLQLVLEHDGNERTDTVLTVRMLTAERDADLLFELTRTRLEQLRLSAPVVSMRLQANDLPPFVPALKDLFEQAPASGMPWPQLRERLRARLGDDALYQIEAVADHRPERAWRRCLSEDAPVSKGAIDASTGIRPPPFPPGSDDGATKQMRQRAQTPHRTRSLSPGACDESFKHSERSVSTFEKAPMSVSVPVSSSSPVQPDHHITTMPGKRPGWLLPEPVPLPVAVGRIISGPERLESGWWDGGDTRRDYYVLETIDGQLAWAYVPAGQPDRWMLHGWFG